jgi:hypothetical protein
MLRTLRMLAIGALTVTAIAWGGRAEALDPLGTVWTEAEGDWHGTWTRVGANEFNAVWTDSRGNRVNGKLRIWIDQRGIVTVSRQHRGGFCDYKGTVSGTSVTGTYQCNNFPPPSRPWSAIIHGTLPMPGGIGNAGGGSGGYGVWAYRLNPNMPWSDACNIAYVGKARGSNYDNPRWNAGRYILVRKANKKGTVDAYLSRFSWAHEDCPDGVVKKSACRACNPIGSLESAAAPPPPQLSPPQHQPVPLPPQVRRTCPDGAYYGDPAPCYGKGNSTIRFKGSDCSC